MPQPRACHGMSFANPEYLWLLVVLAPLAGWMARGRRRRLRDWDALGQSGRPRGDGSLGWLGAIVCLVVALAQPRWGRVLGPPLPPGHDVVLLVDVSRSMGAEDAVPNRLGVAVEAARSLVAALGREGGNRVAVVAFAGRGVVRCPLTENLGAVDSALQALRPGDVRPGGTDLGAALGAALEAFDDQEHEEGRTIVLFSDGEDHGQDWEANVNRLRQARVIVHSIAIGDREAGTPGPVGPRRRVLDLRRCPGPVTSIRRSLPGPLESHRRGGRPARVGHRRPRRPLRHPDRPGRGPTACGHAVARARRAVPAVRARRPGVRAGRVVADRRSPWMASPAGRCGRGRRGRRGEGGGAGRGRRRLGPRGVRIGAIPRGARRLRAGDRARPWRGDPSL